MLNDDGVDVGPWFEARFDSDCNECGEGIEEGDVIRFVDGDVVCTDCGIEWD